MMPFDALDKPWETLSHILDSQDVAALKEFLDQLGPAETARAISRLPHEDQKRLLIFLDPADAAEVIGDISEVQAAEIIEELPAVQAAAIVDELQSDMQADLLAELDTEDAEAILLEMPPEAAADARQLLSYAADEAGGLMITEFLAYRRDNLIRDVLGDLEKNQETYARYHVQYMYVRDEGDRLVGVLRVHDLLFASHGAKLSSVMLKDPLRVYTHTGMDELKEFFDQHKLFGAPVVDDQERLLGVVLPRAVEEASRKRAIRNFLGVSGIIGGEEFRTMPLAARSGRRLSWLSINIVLNILAASIIALYQDTLAAVIALAVFLPMISDMSGCSGNQAVAVSMRELTLGLLKPNEVFRVVIKEAGLGILNGILLGVLLGCVAILWKGNPFLGLVVGGALAVNTLVSVCLGGSLPLILKRFKLDPALVSGPILTTVTDMCGFFFVLSFATVVLPKLMRH